MLRKILTVIGLAMLAAASMQTSFAQQTLLQSRALPATALQKMKAGTIHGSAVLTKLAQTRHTNVTAAVTTGIPGVDTVVNWSDQFNYQGFDSNGNPQSVWPYTMVGTPPESGATTTINAPIVPVTIQLLNLDGSVAVTFGPDRHLVRNAVNSPEFTSNTYTSGTGQFNDQMFRAEFWNRITGGEGEGPPNNWHTLLQPSVKQARTIQVPALTATGGPGWFDFINAQGQPVLAAIDENTFVNLLFPTTVPVTADTPVGAAELAGDITTADLSTFLFNNVVLFLNGDINQCCIIGFHSYDFEPGDASNGNRQRDYVLMYASWLSPGLFLFGFQDVLPFSHEMAETFNDPLINNATPWWLNVDFFTGAGICQNNLEVGDVIEVLTTLPAYAMPGNGFTYHPQNEAMFPWFAFEAHSPAHLGAYSFPDETTLMSLSPGPLLPGCVLAP